MHQGVTGPENSSVLDDVRASLDKEAHEIDKIRLNVVSGSRLLREKEQKVRMLSSAIPPDKVRMSPALPSDKVRTKSRYLK